ncbi:MAG: hypothetical protein K2I06_05225, partial [Ruminococcus sp.]|nr:hypothetical protein [Ruminococcus sp.]
FLTFLVKEISRVVTFLALFNFQDAVPITRLVHYTTLSSFCQVLFSSFSKNFSFVVTVENSLIIIPQFF